MDAPTKASATHTLHNGEETDTKSNASDCGDISTSSSASDNFTFDMSTALQECAGEVQNDTNEGADQNVLADPDSPHDSDVTVTPKNFAKRNEKRRNVHAPSEEVGDLRLVEAAQREQHTDKPFRFSATALPFIPSSSSSISVENAHGANTGTSVNHQHSKSSEGQPSVSHASNRSIQRRFSQEFETRETYSSSSKHLTQRKPLWEDGYANALLAQVTLSPSTSVYGNIHQSDHDYGLTPIEGTRLSLHTPNQNRPLFFLPSSSPTTQTSPYSQSIASLPLSAQGEIVYARPLSDPFVDAPAQQAVNNVYWQTKTALEKFMTEPHPQDFIFGSKIVYRPEAKSPQKDLSEGTRSPLSIPPPPLSAARNLQYTEEARNKLNAQKAIREHWIHTEAKKIAKLYRAKVTAEQTYSAHPTTYNYAAMQNANKEFEDSVDLGRKQEERRNLFMKDKGMTALKTGPENLASDGHAGLQSCVPGTSRVLLGGSMALMERVCSEAVGRDEIEKKTEE
jgi:hypothetical protein